MRIVGTHRLRLALCLSIASVLATPVSWAAPLGTTNQVSAVSGEGKVTPFAWPASLLKLDQSMVLVSGEKGQVTLGEVLTSLGERTQPDARLTILNSAALLTDLATSLYANRWLAAKASVIKDKVKEPDGAPPSELARELFWAEEYMRHEVVASLPTDAVIAKLVASARIANPAVYQVPADKKVRHIMLSSRGQASEAAELRANEVLRQIQGGENFADLAKRVSQDADSAAQGGDLGWVMNRDFETEFKDEVEKLTQPGQRSQVFRTDFGYHIVQLDEVREQRPMNDAEAAALMRQQVFESRNKSVRQRLWQEAREGVVVNAPNVDAVTQAVTMP